MAEGAPGSRAAAEPAADGAPGSRAAAEPAADRAAAATGTDPGPLAGLRVLEFTQAVLGPTCGLVLADLGAEVVRVEPAPKGDPTRYLRGFGMGYYPYFNRNKKSVVLNVKDPRGLEAAHRLLATADVLVENFAPGTMDRLGLGAEELTARYPRLVYCTLKGFLPGPYAGRTALDEVVQMMSGLAYMTGPRGTPLRAGASIVDVMTGVYGAMAVLLALRERDRTGRGQVVRSALFETAAFIMGHHMAYAVASGEEVPPMPERVSAWAVYHQFRTADDQLVFVGVTSDKQWERFCRELGRDDLLADPRLQTNNDRIAQREWLLPELRRVFAGMTLEEAVSLCERADLPFSPIARPEDLFDDPQLKASGSLLPTRFPGGEEGALPALPFRLGDARWEKRADPPLVGEHTGEVLAAAGYAQEELEAMAAAGVVLLGPAAPGAGSPGAGPQGDTTPNPPTGGEQ